MLLLGIGWCVGMEVWRVGGGFVWVGGVFFVGVFVGLMSGVLRVGAGLCGLGCWGGGAAGTR